MNLIPTRFSKSSLRLALLCLVAFQPAALRAELAPEWVSRVPLGTALAAGPAGIHVDPDGVSYYRHLRAFLEHGHHDRLVRAGWIAALVANLEQRGLEH